ASHQANDDDGAALADDTLGKIERGLRADEIDRGADRTRLLEDGFARVGRLRVEGSFGAERKRRLAFGGDDVGGEFASSDEGPGDLESHHADAAEADDHQ